MLVKWVIIKQDSEYSLEPAHLIDDTRHGYLDQSRAEGILSILKTLKDPCKRTYSELTFDVYKGHSEKNRDEINKSTKRAYNLKGER